MHVSNGRGNVPGSLGADLGNKVNVTRVLESFVLIGIVLLTNDKLAEGRTLLTQISNDGTGINTRDGGNTFSGAPLAQTLNSGPVAVLKSSIGDNNTSGLDVGRLEVLQQVVFVSNGRGNTVVSNQGLGEDQDLTTV